MSDDEEVLLEAMTILNETDAAILLRFDVGVEAWIPLSQISKIYRTTPPVICVKEWIVRKKDLEAYVV
jgi:hypothetical protein